MSLSNNDYQDIMRQYEERRLSNYRLHEQRKKDIYTTIPEIKELDRQITANSISLGKQLIVRDDPALREEYRIKNQVLISQKQALLKKPGILLIIWNQSTIVRSVRTPDILDRNNVPAFIRR